LQNEDEPVVETTVVVGPSELTSQTESLNTKTFVKTIEPTFVEPKALPASQKAIQDYFTKRYLAQLTSDSAPEIRLKSLHDLSGEIKLSIEQLLVVRTKETKLLEQQAQIAGLLEGLNQNDKFIISRQYFSELKTDHQKAFKLLIELCSGAPERAALLATIDAQRNNTRNANILYYTSTAFSPVIALSRALIPTKIQNFITSLTPETLDARAKNLTKNLARLVLADLDQQLKKVTIEKQEKVKTLTLGDESFDKLVAAESSDSLLELAAANAVNQSYEELASAILVKQESPIYVKTEIQNALQQRYVGLMQGTRIASEITSYSCAITEHPIMGVAL
jgi:hypothetical protein